MHLRRYWPVAACAAVLTFLVAPGEPRAQERVHLELFADENLYGMTLPGRDGEDPSRARLQILAGTAGSMVRGKTTLPYEMLTPFLGAGVGLWSSPQAFLQLYSEALLPVPLTGSDTAVSPAFRDVEGAHRLRGFLGFGELEDGAMGIDTELEGSIAHAGRYSFSFLRSDIAPEPFTDIAAKATVRPRIGTSDNMALALPLSYSIRREEHGFHGGAHGGFESRRIHAGLALVSYEKEMTHGTIEFVGLSYETSRFLSTAASFGLKPLNGVERIDLRLFHVDGMFGEVEGDVRPNVTMSVGGSWLWDSATQQNVSTVTFDTALGIRGYGAGDAGDFVGAGVGVSRRAGFMADASTFNRTWRVEAYVEAELAKQRVGGSTRIAAEDLRIPLAKPEQNDLGFRHAIATEIFLRPARWASLGVYHIGTDRCSTPGAPRGSDWCHQLGAFLRITGEIGSKPVVMDPDPRTAPDTPPPPDRKLMPVAVDGSDSEDSEALPR